jgi:O-antigen biosynthesis protein
MPIDISVVVCAHDEARWPEITAAVRSLDAQTLAPREIIFVVDHNPALLARIQRELEVRAIANVESKGIRGARNTGVAAASGSVVAFLDDDAVASPDWLAQLAEPYEDESVAGVGGSAKPLWESARPRWFPPEFDWVVGCSYLGQPTRAQEVRNLFGCNMSFRRELVVALGGFRIGYSCDETELCIRLGQRWPEKRIIYLPQASILHHVPTNRTRFRRFLWRCYFEGGSKAVVSRLVGRSSGLSSELSYTLRVLPLGIWRGILSSLRHGDIGGLARAGAIVAGLLSTVAGYAIGMITIKRAARRRGWVGDGQERAGALAVG